MNYDLSDNLKRIMTKLKKKDSETHKAIKRKIIQIINSNPETYKNLKYGLKTLKRVPIRDSFVLVFEYDKANKKIMFIDFDHHDKIYLM